MKEENCYLVTPALPKEDIIWFLDILERMLRLYQSYASRIIDMTWHKFDVCITSPVKALVKGNERFILDWLLERIKILKANHFSDNDIQIFFQVWAGVNPAFWV